MRKPLPLTTGSNLGPSLILLLVLAYVGNWLSFPLFFGVDFIFGSIATLIVISIYGFRWGLVAAAAAGLGSYFLWNHPFGAIAIFGEALFVGLLFRRFRGNLLLVTGIYWIFLGLPQVWAFYSYGLGMDSLASSLAAIKQSINGIMNGVLAGLILNYTPVRRALSSEEEPARSLFQNVFYIFVAAALIPALIVVVFDARSSVEMMKRNNSNRLETFTTGVAVSVERWLTQHTNAIVYLAEVAQVSEAVSEAQIQRLARANKAIWSDFLATAITDENGEILVSEPRGANGLPFSEATREVVRQQINKFRSKASGLRVEVLPSPSSAGPSSKILLMAPYNRDGIPAGMAVATLDLSQLTSLLAHLPGQSDNRVTLLDDRRRVIWSSWPNLSPLADYSLVMKGTVEEMEGDFFIRRPTQEGLSPMAWWGQSNMGVIKPISQDIGWQLIMEAPFASSQAFLYSRHLRSLGFLVVIAIIVLFGSLWVSSLMAKPLALLSKETTDIPQRLELNEEIHWPQSTIFELRSLVENFKSTVGALKMRFVELRESKTQLEQAKEDAETANRLKSAFLANMSHEIRTPLGVMIGFSELIADDEVSADEKLAYVQALKRNGDQLSLIINDILDLSKVEAGHMSVENIDFSVRTTLEEAVSDFHAKAEEKGIAVVLEIPASVPDLVRADPLRLKQILWNLIGNAVKFTSVGDVKVKVLRNDQCLELLVQDSGIGIAPEDQTKLFRAFSQADESMTRKFGGTGLGLALSRGLSHLLGGELALKESVPGKGSVFRLSIKNYAAEPLKSSEASVFPLSPVRSSIVSKDLQGIGILLVEDSVDNQMLISRLLTKVGMEVEVASNGVEGVEQALKGAHDIVIMDLQMPVMDGYTAAQRLRESGYKKPILALTAHAMSDVKERCLEVGFSDHLPKPVNSAELYERILTYVRGEQADNNGPAHLS